MIEGGALEFNAVVGEGVHEGHKRSAIIGAEIEPSDVGAQAASGEVSTAIVELDDLFKSGLTPVVEIGTGEFDVAEAWSFEGSLDVGGIGVSRQRITEAIDTAKAEVGIAWGDAGTEESGVRAGIGWAAAAAVVQECTDRGSGEFRAAVAGVALGATAKEIEAVDLLLGHCSGVARGEAIKGRVV